MADKIEKLTNKQVVTLVNSEFDTALGNPGGEIALERAEAWEYYMSKQFGNEEDDNSSKVVTSDVAEIVDGMMPALLRMFTTADNLVFFDPVGPEDEAGAEQASDYVNHIFFKKNPAFEILFFAMFDALVQKTGLMKCFWDESEGVTTENYANLTEPELLDLMNDDELEPVEKSEHKERLPVPDQPGEFIEVDVTDIQFRRVKKRGQVQIVNVPPEEYRISNDARSLNPAKARMVGHEREVTRSELLEMGFDKKKVKELTPEKVNVASPEKTARRDKADDRTETTKTIDKSQDKFILREAYQHMDVDGDGRAELMQVFIVGTTLLEKEPIDRQPFHMICPHPLPHKHIGRSVAEKVMDIQLVGSTILRQTLNNLYHSNNPGHGVWEAALGDTTMADLLTTELGRVATFERPVAESYAPLTVPFTAGESFPMLEYFDKVKRDRTGVSADSEGMSPEALKNIQTSVLSESISISKMKIDAIARVFAETGFKTLFLHIYELMLKHQPKAEIVKLRNQWVKVNPSEWKSRENMTVNIGLGIGTREQNSLNLNEIWDKQAAMAAGGGMNLTVTPQNMYNTAVEMVKNANYKTPELFFTDPKGQPAPPPSDEEKELEKQQADIKEREQVLDAERQRVNTGKLELAGQEQGLKHQREIMALEEKGEARQDKFMLENERLKTQLAELQTDMQVTEIEMALKTSKTSVEIDKLRADTREVNERIRKSRTDAGEAPETKSELDVAREAKEIEKIDAEIDRIQAETLRIDKETDSTEIENAAARSGLAQLAEDNAESQETE